MRRTYQNRLSWIEELLMIFTRLLCVHNSLKGSTVDTALTMDPTTDPKRQRSNKNVDISGKIKTKEKILKTEHILLFSLFFFLPNYLYIIKIDNTLLYFVFCSLTVADGRWK